MADRFWVASVSPADWNSTASWSATRGGASGASVPGAADNAYVEGPGTVAPDTNLSANTATIVLLEWTAPYAMGSAATPLGVSATTLRIRNTNFVNLSALGANGIRYCDIDLASSAVVNLSVASTGGFASDGVNAGYLHVNCNAAISGEVCSVAASVLRIYGGNSTMDYNATACSRVEVDPGASFQFERSIGTVLVSGGGRSKAKNNAPISVGVYVEPNGKHVHESYGTVALSDVKPGGIASASTNPYRFTLTARVRRKGALNFDDTSKIDGTPTDTGVGQVSVV